MNNGVDIKLTIDPKDKYEKAKKDCIQAKISIQDLTPFQQQQLANELLGAQMADAILNFMKQNFNRNF